LANAGPVISACTHRQSEEVCYTSTSASIIDYNKLIDKHLIIRFCR